ncbi:PqqD family protein [Bacteroidota bacterium]
MESLENYYPLKSCRYETKDGIVTLFFKDPKPSLILRLFFKKLAAKELKFDLDDVGAFIWNLCDGSLQVKDIIEKVEAEFGDKVEPASNRVDIFMRQLSKGNFIKLYEKK